MHYFHFNCDGAFLKLVVNIKQQLALICPKPGAISSHKQTNGMYLICCMQVK